MEVHNRLNFGNSSSYFIDIFIGLRDNENIFIKNTFPKLHEMLITLLSMTFKLNIEANILVMVPLG